MNLNNFTIKASEVVQQAQQLAFNAQNPNIETEHLLKALLTMEDSPIEYLLKKNNVTINLVQMAIVQGNDAPAKLLKDAGLTEKGLIAVSKN
jgi:ATP-dependent Clp protease ATP-binding subunit ClpB